MQTLRPVALQLSPFSAYLESGLSARFEVIRWFELQPSEQAAWLSANASVVRAVVTGGQTGCSNELMLALPSLGLIALNGVGVDKIDIEFARSRGVRVATTPGVLADDVADLAVGLIIALLRDIPAGHRYVRAGDWVKGDLPLARKVTGLRFGIVGLGSIGATLAARLAPFGPVAYTGPRRKPVPYDFHPDPLALAGASDVLILACPANAATRGIVGASVLDALGPRGYLVNIARGSLVDEAALVAALADNRIAGAALDVFENEPNVLETLRCSDRVLLTPHIGCATVETRTRMADVVLGHLDALLDGGVCAQR